MKNILLFACILTGSFVFAQKKQNVYLLKNNGREVQIADSADFIRVIQEPDEGSSNFNLMEFYMDKSKKLIGHVSAFQPSLVYEGVIISYDRNGARKKVETYEKGSKKGISNYFYSNGQLQKSMEYGMTEGMHEPGGFGKTIIYKMISYFDSTGVQMVKDGNGIVKEENTEQKIKEEGAYVNGVKEGKWTGSLMNDTFEEEYKNGVFISGIATYNGTAHPYTKQFELPDFKGGISRFLEYVGNVFVYPADAAQQHIGGRVLVSFVVEKDGSLSNIKIINSVSRSIDAEALRVIRRSSNWIPGTQHGIPVRVTFTQPIMIRAN